MAADSPTSPQDRAALKAAAQARLVARRQGARRIRHRVAALAVTLFIASFGAIYVQLAEGHDPALSSTSTTATATGTSRTAASGSTAGSSASQSSSSDNKSSSSDNSTPSSVTTSQS